MITFAGGKVWTVNCAKAAESHEKSVPQCPPAPAISRLSLMLRLSSANTSRFAAFAHVTRLTWLTCKPGVSPDGSRIRLRQHGTFLSFSQKFGAQSQIFVKKDVQFRPAGGDICFQTSDRVSPVMLRLSSAGISRFAAFAHVTAFVVQTSPHVLHVLASSPPRLPASFPHHCAGAISTNITSIAPGISISFSCSRRRMWVRISSARVGSARSAW